MLKNCKWKVNKKKVILHKYKAIIHKNREIIKIRYNKVKLINII
jgi:hypothetical protein